MPYMKILLATDGSENSKIAAKRVAKMQKRSGAEVVIFHAEQHYFVPEERPIGFPFLSVSNTIPRNNYIDYREQFEKWGTRMLNETEKIFTDEGLKVEKRLVMDLSPSDYAIEVVKKEKFDLVVVGCQGHHSTLRKLFIGSVAEKMVNEVPCDVLIVRNKTEITSEDNPECHQDEK